MTASSKTNSKVASKEAPSAELKDFLVGNIDREQYMIVDIATQYMYVYKNKKTGSNPTQYVFYTLLQFWTNSQPRL